jgi:hypothetical protein
VEEPKEYKTELPNTSLKDRFLLLTQELKQRVVNTVLDKAIDKYEDKFKFRYHGYTPAPAGPNNADQGYEAGKIANER